MLNTLVCACALDSFHLSRRLLCMCMFVYPLIWDLRQVDKSATLKDANNIISIILKVPSKEKSRKYGVPISQNNFGLRCS